MSVWKYVSCLKLPAAIPVFLLRTVEMQPLVQQYDRQSDAHVPVLKKRESVTDVPITPAVHLIYATTWWVLGIWRCPDLVLRWQAGSEFFDVDEQLVPMQANVFQLWYWCVEGGYGWTKGRVNTAHATRGQKAFDEWLRFIWLLNLKRQFWQGARWRHYRF